MIRTQLVSVRTEDQVLLHGALFEPANPGPVAALIVHGYWGNFYTGLGRFLPQALAEAGFPSLSLNNRGHDLGTIVDNEPCIGGLRDRFEDSHRDIAAGIRLLRERGYERLVLVAHSFGTSRIVYAQVKMPDPHVAGLILCSPPPLMRGVARHYLDVPYQEAVDIAQGMVDAGKGDHTCVFRHTGPVPFVATAATFLSIWGPDPNHDVTTFIGELETPLLTVVCDGEYESQRSYASLVHRLAEKATPRDLVFLPGGDHYYCGAEEHLVKTVVAGLRKMGRWAGP